MSLNNEQIGKDRRYISANWRWIKQQSHRKARRLGKRLLDDAPPLNRYRGWVA